jgi:hypothetical protein
MVKVVGDVPGSAVGCRQALLLPVKGSFHSTCEPVATLWPKPSLTDYYQPKETTDG